MWPPGRARACVCVLGVPSGVARPRRPGAGSSPSLDARGRAGRWRPRWREAPPHRGGLRLFVLKWAAGSLEARTYERPLPRGHERHPCLKTFGPFWRRLLLPSRLVSIPAHGAGESCFAVLGWVCLVGCLKPRVCVMVSVSAPLSVWQKASVMGEGVVVCVCSSLLHFGVRVGAQGRQRGQRSESLHNGHPSLQPATQPHTPGTSSWWK